MIKKLRNIKNMDYRISIRFIAVFQLPIIRFYISDKIVFNRSGNTYNYDWNKSYDCGTALIFDDLNKKTTFCNL